MTNEPEAVSSALSIEALKPEAGSTFVIAFADARFDLVLRDVTALKYHDPRFHSRQPFSLLFLCADTRVLGQGTYALEHERLGMLEIFLVPVGADGGGVQYQAVFN